MALRCPRCGKSVARGAHTCMSLSCMSERPDAAPPKTARPFHQSSSDDKKLSAPPSGATQPVPDGWVSCPSIQYSGREYAVVWQHDKPFLCCRINGQWMVEHVIGHPEDAPEKGEG